MSPTYDPVQELFDERCVKVLNQEGKAVIKEPREPVMNSLMGGDGIIYPAWLRGKDGQIWITRAVSVDKIQKWSWKGFQKCTYKELGFTEKFYVGDKTRTPAQEALFKDQIVCKIPLDKWATIVVDKDEKRVTMAQRVLRGVKTDINKTARDKYGVRRKEGIATGTTLNDEYIDNLGKKK